MVPAGSPEDEQAGVLGVVDLGRVRVHGEQVAGGRQWTCPQSEGVTLDIAREQSSPSGFSMDVLKADLDR